MGLIKPWIWFKSHVKSYERRLGRLAAVSTVVRCVSIFCALCKHCCALLEPVDDRHVMRQDTAYCLNCIYIFCSWEFFKGALFLCEKCVILSKGDWLISTPLAWDEGTIGGDRVLILSFFLEDFVDFSESESFSELWNKSKGWKPLVQNLNINYFMGIVGY